jgi:hypothetical protein
MLVGGLDLSLTKIGCARTHPERRSLWVETLQPQGRGVPRLQNALTQVVRALAGVALVVIEGYSFGSVQAGKDKPRGSRGHAQGELGGVIKLGIWQMKPRPEIVIVAPNSMKLFATGYGLAEKGQVLLAAKMLLGYGRSSYDEADALWLAQMAVQYYGLPGALDLPDKKLSALASVRWPPRLFRATGPDVEF